MYIVLDQKNSLLMHYCLCKSLFSAGEDDFELIEIISFPSTAFVNDTICRNITAVNDIIPEGDEQFIITVVPINPNDGVNGLNTAIFTIQDNVTGKNSHSILYWACMDKVWQ